MIEPQTLQTVWYLTAITVALITIFTYFIKLYSKRKSHKRLSRYYSDSDKINYYKSRMQDKNLTYSQRRFAEQTYKQLKKG